MEKQKPNSLTLTKREEYHKELMVNILRNVADTPLVLKGGTALYLGYGLNRFSEDLDFDSSKKINLFNKITSSAPYNIVVNNINIKKDTTIVSRYIVNYQIRDTDIEDKLKIEISYRSHVPDKEVKIKNGIRFLSLECIIDNKLSAAYDGDNIRTKGRDLFDLHFLARQYSDSFDLHLAKRLQNFAQDPDKLISLYYEDIRTDVLLNKIMDTEQFALELHYMANDIMENIINQEKGLTERGLSMKAAQIQEPSSVQPATHTPAQKSTAANIHANSPVAEKLRQALQVENAQTSTNDISTTDPQNKSDYRPG